MAYTLGSKCAKNLCKRTILLQLIIKKCGRMFFLEHSVYSSFCMDSLNFPLGANVYRKLPFFGDFWAVTPHL